MFLEGHIIEFVEDDQLKVGYVRKQEHDRLQVIDPRGRHIRVGQDRVVLVHEKSNEDSFPGHARELSEKIQVRQAEMDVELLWESLSGNLREFSSAELAEIFFAEPSPAAASAVFRSLSGDSLFFRRKGVQFLPKTHDQVETERTRRGRQHENERLRDQLTETLKQLMRFTAIEPSTSINHVLDRLQHWLGRQGGEPAGTILEELAGATHARETAYDILRRAGRIDSRRDRFLVLAGIEEAFPTAVEAAAAALLPYRHVPGRVDYREVPAFTIDDADTLEVDDAISLSRKDGRIVVGIHIADVSSFLRKGDTLESEAGARLSTIYLPATRVRMLPDRLSTDLASLRQGEDRPALTVEVAFDEQLQRESHRFVSSTIRVVRRLTYPEADQMIEGAGEGEDLKVLHDIALQLKEQRTARGAVTARRPELQVHVDDSGIHVEKLDPNSPSRMLVTEMMILCNALAADFASLHSLPIIYRTQEPRDASAPAPAEAMDPLSFEKLRKTFKRSRLSLTPSPHSGLGVSAYTQASSPIRRYADLVTQQQFTAFLQGAPAPYDRETLTRIVASAEAAEQEIRGIEDRSTNYWLLEYLAREKPAQPMKACVLDRKGNIELEDYYVRGKLADPGNEEPGAAISVMIDSIHPDKGEVRFRRA